MLSVSTMLSQHQKMTGWNPPGKGKGELEMRASTGDRAVLTRNINTVG